MEGKLRNRHDSRESWLRAATNELREHFRNHELELPEKIRFAISFTSHGRKLNSKKQAIRGECWHPPASADGHHEIIVSAHIDDSVEVLEVLVHELVHAALPADARHGPEFREAALKLGLEGPMRAARPGKLLRERLNGLAGQLGPLPHARLDFLHRSMQGAVSDRERKQPTRMHKAECVAVGCGYTVRVSAKWLQVGAPCCPLHGPMHAELPEGGPGGDGTVIDGEFVEAKEGGQEGRPGPARDALAAAPLALSFDREGMP